MFAFGDQGGLSEPDHRSTPIFISEISCGIFGWPKSCRSYRAGSVIGSALQDFLLENLGLLVSLGQGSIGPTASRLGWAISIWATSLLGTQEPALHGGTTNMIKKRNK